MLAVAWLDRVPEAVFKLAHGRLHSPLFAMLVLHVSISCYSRGAHSGST